MLWQNYTLDTLDFLQRHEWGNGKEGEGLISVTVFSEKSSVLEAFKNIIWRRQ